MKLKELVSFIITPLIIVGILFFWDLDPNNRAITHAFCITLLMAVWWITEAVPLAVTSLLPVALFPLFGVLDSKTVSSAYFNDVIFLFMGGFLVALAMEKWNLHQRIALKILSMTGVKPANILAGFMVASFFLSMWISNTATAMMMLPIAMSIIKQLDEQGVFLVKDVIPQVCDLLSISQATFYNYLKEVKYEESPILSITN